MLLETLVAFALVVVNVDVDVVFLYLSNCSFCSSVKPNIGMIFLSIYAPVKSDSPKLIFSNSVPLKLTHLNDELPKSTFTNRLLMNDPPSRLVNTNHITVERF